MSETAKPTDPALGAAAEDAGYRVLARKYRPASFDDLIGQDAMVRTISNAFESRAASRRPGSSPACAASARPRPRASWRARSITNCPTARSPQPTIDMPTMGVHCQAIIESRHIDVLEMDAASHNQRRGRAPDQRRHPLRAGVGALQGLYPRRSAHALGRGVQRAAEDAGRAAAARQVHLRHHRNPQSAGDGAVALPALRSAPGRRRAAGQASGRHRRQGEDRGRAGGAGADRARGGRLGARFAVAVRSGDRACRGPGARGRRAADARPCRPRAHRRSVRGADEGRRRRRAQANCASNTTSAPIRRGA